MGSQSGEFSTMTHIFVLDRIILGFLNQFAQRSNTFDKFVGMLFGNALLEGGFITSLLWWAWFRKRGNEERDRGILISGILLSIVALAITRSIAMLSPFRFRPRYVDSLHFRLPLGSENFHIINWSSFPSDHAALYFSLATCLCFVSRKVGVVALLHAFFVVCMTRIYLGVHYPTDILAGMAIGVGTTCLALHKGMRQAIAHPLLQWVEASPRSFYPVFSLIMLTVAMNFDPVEELVVDACRAAQGFIHVI